MKTKGIVAASIMAGVFGASVLSGVVSLDEYSVQHALNILATGSFSVDPHEYSEKAALNILVDRALGASSTSTSEQDSFVATVCFVIDDQSKEFWGQANHASDSLLINNTGAAKKSIRDLLQQYEIKPGFSIGAYYVQHSDTASLILSPANLRSMRARGWEMGSGGWDEKTWFSGTQLIARGNYTQAQLNTAMRQHFYGNMLAMRDTLGIGAPRFHSWSQSSACALLLPWFKQAGLEYGVSTLEAIFSGDAGAGKRPHTSFSLFMTQHGTWGTGGASNRYVSAAPGIHESQYEICGVLSEVSDTAQTYETLRRAMQTRGLVVWNAHKFSTWETNLQQQDGVQDVLEWIAARVAEGRMRVLIPSQAFDIYYKAPISPSAVFYTDNFQDLDGEGHRDFWFEGAGLYAAGDTALLKLAAGTIRHGGKRAYSLNWAEGASVGVPPIASTSVNDSTFDMNNAGMCVVPPQGGGWTAEFEIWVCADSIANATTKLSGALTGGLDQTLNREVGVMFWAFAEHYNNRWGVTNQPNFDNMSRFDTGGAAVSRFPIWTSHGDVTAGTGQIWPNNCIRLQRRNAVQRADHTWSHLIATYDVPEGADYLVISLWKDILLKANAVYVSDYKLRFYRKDANTLSPFYSN